MASLFETKNRSGFLIDIVKDLFSHGTCSPLSRKACPPRSRSTIAATRESAARRRAADSDNSLKKLFPRRGRLSGPGCFLLMAFRLLTPLARLSIAIAELEHPGERCIDKEASVSQARNISIFFSAGRISEQGSHRNRRSLRMRKQQHELHRAEWACCSLAASRLPFSKSAACPAHGARRDLRAGCPRLVSVTSPRPLSPSLSPVSRLKEAMSTPAHTGQNAAESVHV